MPLPDALARATFPEPVLHVLRRLGAAGHRSWLVGGAVRDLLLHHGRDANDFDVATPARPDEVAALFPKVIPTGIEHGTVTVLVGGEPIEVTTFRGEGAYTDGRRPESVTFHEDLEADLARRDFTMNALAFDPLAGELRDPFGGEADLRRRLVRAVGDPVARFGEDGLRPMRAVRFAAQLGYELDPATQAAIPGALPVVRKVSLERIADELTRLVVAPDAARAVELMRTTGLLETVLPALAARPAPEVSHAVAVLAATPAEPALRLAALLHTLPAGDVGRTLLHLRLSRRISDDTAALVRAHACRLAGRGHALPAAAAEVRRWLAAAGPARAAPLLDLARAEAAALAPDEAEPAQRELEALTETIAHIRRAGDPLTPQELALDGRAVMRILGAAPGPHVGEALRHLLERVLEHPEENDEERLTVALRRWWDAEGRSL
ncbi:MULTISPECIES: CCA tRNA nucleotidyltransferase [Anaeromyxobacter]|uniref:CCA tRNA nucleotidyltransferase n=1 Tax=Anaeromyxobacter TaxID=161492 RepID=UPI001F59418F|nr:MULTISPECIES: CCA tRNA nucleotidyltransferase [unclassified Anaeromyxobacter]